MEDDYNTEQLPSTLMEKDKRPTAVAAVETTTTNENKRDEEVEEFDDADAESQSEDSSGGGGEEERDSAVANRDVETTSEKPESGSKFIIDMNTLKADMKRKSAKLLAKLGTGGVGTGVSGGGGSSSALGSSMLKQLVNELNVTTETSSSSPSSEMSVAHQHTAIDLDSIDPTCFARVQFRCESKNAELNRLVDRLRSKLAETKAANSMGIIY